MTAEADAAGLGVSESAGASELADPELSLAGLSAGLDSPPPHASQASGTAAMRKREAMGKRWARLMGPIASASPNRIKAGNLPEPDGPAGRARGVGASCERGR